MSFSESYAAPDTPEDSSKLNSIWKNLTSNVEDCVKLLRKRKFCENVVMRICVESNDRVHMYSFPSSANLQAHIDNAMSEEASATLDFNFSQTENSMMDEAQWKTLQLEVISCTAKTMSMSDLRTLCSGTRELLKQPVFSWPFEAQREFTRLRNETPPPAPGRVGCKKDKVLLILNLAARFSDDWRNALSLSLYLPALRVSREFQFKTEGRCNEHEKPSGKESSEVPLRALVHKGCLDTGNQTSNSIVIEKEPYWWPKRSDHNLSTVVQVVNSLPEDTLRAEKRKKDWLNISDLAKKLLYNNDSQGITWYVHETPADGNCLFSSIMMASYTRHLVCKQVSTVENLRKALCESLKELSLAGKSTSRYRREWLAGCIFDLDNVQVRTFCERVLENLVETVSSRDIEKLLLPLRVYVNNWASMIGHDHWGGHLSVEMSLLSTITGCALEVMRKVEGNVSDAVKMHDMRCGGTPHLFARTGLYLPVYENLPAAENGFSGAVSTARGTSIQCESGWIGRYPLLRIVLENRHYSACSFKVTNPIPSLHSSWTYYDESRSLSEPYSDLNDEEGLYFERSTEMVQIWRNASNNGDMDSSHTDHVILNVKGQTLTVSQISRVMDPRANDSSDAVNYMLSDDIVTVYMLLLQTRHEKIISRCKFRSEDPPESCYYMNGWFYGTISRGEKGPTSQRKRVDLHSYSKIIIPALNARHWVLAVCFQQQSLIGVYDPLGSSREDIFSVVKSWAERKLRTHGVHGWQFVHLREFRGSVQKTSFDCGVFVCKAAESIGLGAPIQISQWDIEYVRRRMVMEFTRGEASELRHPIGSTPL